MDRTKQRLGHILISKQLQPYDLQRVGEVRILRDDKPHATARLINHFTVFAQTAWEGPTVQPAGVVLSGVKLVDNFDYRQELSKLMPEAIGGEMEGAGLYVASQEHKVDWIVIKAISDWADGKKRREKEKRQKVAATNAITFVIRSLEYAPLKLQEANGSAAIAGAIDSPFSEFKSWATGDPQFDRQLKRLADYHPDQDHGSAQLVRLIRPLFQRAAFYPEPEGDWLSFAYVVMATRFLIQDSLGAVEDKQLRGKLRAVIKAIAGLETLVQKIIGPRVTLSRHAEQFIRDKRQFVEQLGILANWENAFGDPKRAQIVFKANSERVRLLSQLEKKLQAAALL